MMESKLANTKRHLLPILQRKFANPNESIYDSENLRIIMQIEAFALPRKIVEITKLNKFFNVNHKTFLKKSRHATLLFLSSTSAR